MSTQTYSFSVLANPNMQYGGWQDTLIDIPDGGYFSVQASGGVRPWPAADPTADIGLAGPDGYERSRWPPDEDVFMPNERFMKLIGRFGQNGQPFAIGSRNSLRAPLVGGSTQHRLWLTVNEVSTAVNPNSFADNPAGSFSVTVAVQSSNPSEPSNEGSCDYNNYDTPTTLQPVNLRTGEKTLAEVDLRLQTPVGELNFTRLYRQVQQNHPFYQRLMGLGWIHNHAFRLNFNGTVAQISLPDGGILTLDEAAGSSGALFNARSGSSLYLQSTGTNEFTLVGYDHSEHVFELNGSTWRLNTRTWPNGETWSYDYDGNHNLVSVSDGYGRQLQFSYIGHTNYYDDGLLWRVGDQTASGLNTGTPSGCYVEFSYMPARNDGAIVGQVNLPPSDSNSAKPLLSSVRDVRGQTWAYDYYGQASGETAAKKLNWLTEILSPSVDTTGDGTLDGSLVLQRLNYTVDDNQTQLVVNGGMELDSGWTAISGAIPTTNERSTTQVDTGTYARRVVTSAAHQGIEGTAWKLFKGRVYTITARVYPVSGSVRMQASATQVLNQFSVGNGSWRTLSVTGVVADTSHDNCRLQFVANGGSAEFYIDTVSIIEENPWPVNLVQELGISGGGSALVTKTFDFQPERQALTEETVDGCTTAYHFDNGTYRGTTDPGENFTFQSLGDNYRPLGQTDANGYSITTRWTSDGRRLEQVGDALGQQVEFEYAPDDVLYFSRDVAGNRTLYFYEDASLPRHPTRILATLPERYIINGEMEDDNADAITPFWGSISTAPPSTNERSNTRAYSGTYSRRVVATALNQGIESRGFSLASNRAYVAVAQVYVVSGSVRMQMSNTAGFSQVSTATGRWETLVAIYYNNSNDAGRLQFVANGGAAEFFVDSVDMLDSSMILQWQEFGYDSQGRVLDERQVNPADGSTIVARIRRSYYTAGNGNGLLQSVLQEDLAGVNDVRTTYFYDEAGRVIQTNQNSNLGGCTRSRTLYDSAGNVIASICNFDLDVSGTPSASSGQASDAFDETITSSWSATGISGEWLRYDFGASQAKTITSVALTAMETNLNEMPQDFTIEASNNGSSWTTLHTVTDEMDWAARETRVFPFANTTAYRYWRLAFTAANGASNIALAEVDFIPTNYPATTTDALNLRADTSNPDQNRVTLYEYDTLGRRIKTVLNAGTSEAQTTLTLYDALGRVVRTIINYVAQGSSGPATWVWDDTTDKQWELSNGTAISHGTDLTQNLIQDTVYNARGLVESQRDVLGTVTRYVYNAAGRQVKVIQNYISNGVDPSLWGWINNQWEDGSTHPINHGANNDQNIIITSQYDPNGNLVKVVDPLGNVAFTVYDALNRAVKTIRNAKSDATLDLNPGQQGYNAANDPRVDAYSPSASVDRDLITRFEYDRFGRILRRYDELGVCTHLVYDALGRPLYSLQNWIDVIGVDLGSLTWHTSEQYWEDKFTTVLSHGPNNDRNIVTRTFYDSQGRVMSTQAVNGLITRLVYDGLGRQVKTIQNWVDNSVDPLLWVWVNGQWEDGSTHPINHGANNDQNIITETVYDSDGRVAWNRDVLGRQQRPVYDAVGRRTRMVQNWQSGGVGYTTDPMVWTWDNGQERWEDNNGVEIPHGSNTDVNLVTETTYDDFGRVLATYDPRHNQTKFFYNILGRRTKTVTNYVDGVYSSSTPDEDLIQTVTYDLAGRVASTTDPAGKVTRWVYDQLGRRIRTIANYIIQGASDPADWVWDATQWEDGSNNAISHGAAFDQNLISDTIYNRVGQVTATRDARGTLTSFTYDAAGRRQVLMQASGSVVESHNYTVYDKGGRVLLSVRNWQPSGRGYLTDPTSWMWDANQLRWEDGTNAVIPHGANSDQNLVTGYSLDALGRVLTTTDPMGHVTHIAYYVDGRARTSIDAAGYSTEHRYDALRRLVRVVQAYQTTGENVDPANWIWINNQWEDGINHSIDHGTRHDRNIVVDLTLDKVGRRTSLRDPRGNLTTYSYDQLDRRTGLTNPLSQAWTTAHSDLSGGRTRQVATDPLTFQIQQDFDRLGRLVQLRYLGESTPKATPDVTFTYDAAGNRTLMSESNGVSTVRHTRYTFDQARRVSAVEFDTNGDSTYDQTVSYKYDQGGLRTELRLPDNKTITYTYDTRGQLVSLTDWDSQASRYAYDQSGRLVAVERPNGMHSRYTYDAGSRLRQLRHTANNKVLGHFAYEVDARGNRTQAVEMLLGTGTGTQTITSDNSLVDYYQGSWSTSGLFRQTTDPGAKLRLLFFGKQATLTLGTGADHGICDIYVNNRLWQSMDSYATSTGEDGSIVLNLASEGPHMLEIRNTADKHPNATGRKLRFKQLVVSSGPLYDLHTIQYAVDDSTPGYDALGRVVAAKYRYGGRTSGPTFREYAFSYDVAGNRTQQIETLSGTPTTLNYSYDNANRLSQVGAQAITYDAAGRLTNDGTLTYAWDRASRLLSAGGSSYTYNGAGQRLTQTVGANVTQYLLDTQPGLYKVLTATTGAAVDHYVHGPTGIHAHKDSSDNWEWMLQDGLGSVRSVLDNSMSVLHMQHYVPYGTPWGAQGTTQSPFGFTGEPTDPNSLVHLRARYYNPVLGVFPSLDPREGNITQCTGFNRYAYVQGDPITLVDPSGMVGESPSAYGTCTRPGAQSSCEDYCRNNPLFAICVALCNAAGWVEPRPPATAFPTNTPPWVPPPTNSPYPPDTATPTNTPSPIGTATPTTPSIPTVPSITPSPTPLPITLASVFNTAATPLAGANTANYGPDHYAIDIVPSGVANAAGESVYAVCDARVQSILNDPNFYSSNIVQLYCKNDEIESKVIIYSHVCPSSTLENKNQVNAGDLIGTLASLPGQGGDCEDDGSQFDFYGSPHLHFQVRRIANIIAGQRIPIDPPEPFPPAAYLVECQSATSPSWCTSAWDPND